MISIYEQRTDQIVCDKAEYVSTAALIEHQVRSQPAKTAAKIQFGSCILLRG